MKTKKKKRNGYVEYISNNSGGEWWLKDAHWYALEKAGWVVKWVKDQKDMTFRDKPNTDRWLGALARSAVRHGLSLREAAAEWEEVTGLSATEAGCPCCGQPHNFTEYTAEGKYVDSGPHASYSTEW